MMKSQKDDTETIHLTEEGKKIGIDEVIKYSEIRWYHYLVLNAVTKMEWNSEQIFMSRR